MRPYNHVSELSKVLRRFSTYLNSQGIHYRIFSPDYDTPDGSILVQGRLFVGTKRLRSYIPNSWSNSHLYHDHMPVFPI
jgi:hypothetical protein